jgi:hypothetical protein
MLNLPFRVIFSSPLKIRIDPLPHDSNNRFHHRPCEFFLEKDSAPSGREVTGTVMSLGLNLKSSPLFKGRIESATALACKGVPVTGDAEGVF